MANLYEHAAALLPLFLCQTEKLTENPAASTLTPQGNDGTVSLDLAAKIAMGSETA
jgi:hypothetical protein